MEQTITALEEIKMGGEEMLKKIYREYRLEFLSWAMRHFQVPREEAIDIFQDAVIVFYKNVVSGKISDLDASIKTYLFGICKKKLLKYSTKKGRVVLIEDEEEGLFQEIDWSLAYESNLSARKELIQSALQQLTEICLKVINMVYYQRFSMEAVKEHMGYNSEEVARTTKKKCMRKLEKIVRDKLAT